MWRNLWRERVGELVDAVMKVARMQLFRGKYDFPLVAAFA